MFLNLYLQATDLPGHVASTEHAIPSKMSKETFMKLPQLDAKIGSLTREEHEAMKDWIIIFTLQDNNNVNSLMMALGHIKIQRMGLDYGTPLLFDLIQKTGIAMTYRDFYNNIEPNLVFSIQQIKAQLSDMWPGIFVGVVQAILDQPNVTEKDAKGLGLLTRAVALIGKGRKDAVLELVKAEIAQKPVTAYEVAEWMLVHDEIFTSPEESERIHAKAEGGE